MRLSAPNDRTVLAWASAALAAGCITTTDGGDESATTTTATTSGSTTVGDTTSGSRGDTTGSADGGTTHGSTSDAMGTTAASTGGTTAMADPRRVCPDYADHVATDCVGDPEAYTLYDSYCTTLFGYAPEHGGACVAAVEDYFACLTTAPCRDILMATACVEAFGAVSEHCGF